MQRLPFSLVLFVLTAQVFNSLKAQEINEKNFVLYTKQQGLSDNAITDVTQDSNGYLWIAWLQWRYHYYDKKGSSKPKARYNL